MSKYTVSSVLLFQFIDVCWITSITDDAGDNNKKIIKVFIDKHTHFKMYTYM